MKSYALGIAIAVATFIEFAPSAASSSTTQTAETQACNYLASASASGYWSCPIAGGSWLESVGPNVAYVDFQVFSSTYVTANLVKKTYSGTYSSDSVSGTYGSGSHDVKITAVNTKASNSLWDYYYVYTNGLPGSPTAYLWGMAVQSN